MVQDIQDEMKQAFKESKVRLGMQEARPEGQGGSRSCPGSFPLGPISPFGASSSTPGEVKYRQ